MPIPVPEGCSDWLSCSFVCIKVDPMFGAQGISQTKQLTFQTYTALSNKFFAVQAIHTYLYIELGHPSRSISLTST